LIIATPPIIRPKPMTWVNPVVTPDTQGSVIYRAKQLKCHKKQAVLAF
jgi:hypothetical protein